MLAGHTITTSVVNDIILTAVLLARTGLKRDKAGKVRLDKTNCTMILVNFVTALIRKGALPPVETMFTTVKGKFRYTEDSCDQMAKLTESMNKLSQGLAKVPEFARSLDFLRNMKPPQQAPNGDVVQAEDLANMLGNAPDDDLNRAAGAKPKSDMDKLVPNSFFTGISTMKSMLTVMAVLFAVFTSVGDGMSADRIVGSYKAVTDLVHRGEFKMSTNLLSSVRYLFIVVKNYLVTGSTSLFGFSERDFAKLEDRYAELSAKFKEFDDGERLDLNHREFLQQVELLETDSVAAMKNLKLVQGYIGAIAQTGFHNTRAKIVQLVTAVRTRHNLFSMRRSPFTAYVVGDSNVGKTSVADLIMKGFATAYKLECTDAHVYKPSNTSEYDDAYTPNMYGMIIDDIACYRPQQIAGLDQTLSEFLRLIGNFPVMANYSHVDKKGSCTMAFDCIVATGNELTFQSQHYFATPAAAIRRFPTYVVPVVKPQFRSDPAVNSLAPGLENAQGQFPDYWEFNVYNVVRANRGGQTPKEFQHVKCPVGVSWQLDAVYTDANSFVAAMAGRAKTHQENQNKVLSGHNCIQDMEMCDTCYFPRAQCRCARIAAHVLDNACVPMGRPVQEQPGCAAAAMCGPAVAGSVVADGSDPNIGAALAAPPEVLSDAASEDQSQDSISSFDPDVEYDKPEKSPKVKAKKETRGEAEKVKKKKRSKKTQIQYDRANKEAEQGYLKPNGFFSSMGWLCAAQTAMSAYGAPEQPGPGYDMLGDPLPEQANVNGPTAWTSAQEDEENTVLARALGLFSPLGRVVAKTASGVSYLGKFVSAPLVGFFQDKFYKFKWRLIASSLKEDMAIKVITGLGAVGVTAGIVAFLSSMLLTSMAANKGAGGVLDDQDETTDPKYAEINVWSRPYVVDDTQFSKVASCAKGQSDHDNACSIRKTTAICQFKRPGPGGGFCTVNVVRVAPSIFVTTAHAIPPAYRESNMYIFMRGEGSALVEMTLTPEQTLFDGERLFFFCNAIDPPSVYDWLKRGSTVKTEFLDGFSIRRHADAGAPSHTYVSTTKCSNYCYKEMNLSEAPGCGEVFQGKDLYLKGYDAQAASTGMCGAPIVLKSGQATFVAGIHVAGDGKRADNASAVGVVLTAEHVDAAKSYFDSRQVMCSSVNGGDIPLKPGTKLGPLHKKSPVCKTNKRLAVTALGSIESEGPGRAERGGSKKSKVVASVFKPLVAGTDMDGDWCAPVVTGSEVRVNYLEKATVKPYAGMPQTTINFVSQAMGECISVSLMRAMRTATIQKLDDVQAQNGVENDSYLEPMDHSKSAGYPFEGTKADISDVNPERKYPFYRWKSNVQEHIEEVRQVYRSGRRANVIFNCFFKDEPVSKKKHDEKKTRIICGCPVALQHISRQWFLPICANLAKHKCWEGAVGLNCCSNSWGVLYRHLATNKRGRRVAHQAIAGDFAGYDWTAINSATMAGAFGILTIIAERMGMIKSAEDHEEIKGFISDITHANLDYFGDIIQIRGNPSGQPFTTQVNCLIVSILMRLAWLAHRTGRRIDELDEYFDDLSYLEHLYDFEKMNVLITYGDDHILTTEDSTFTFSKVKRVFGEVDIPYTDAEKTDMEFSFETLDEVSFLKRRFANEKDLYTGNNVIMAPLSEKSIHRSFNMVVKGRLSDKAQGVEVMVSHARELSMHHPAAYSMHVSKFDLWAKKLDMGPALEGRFPGKCLRRNSYFPEQKEFHRDMYSAPVRKHFNDATPMLARIIQRFREVSIEKRRGASMALLKHAGKTVFVHVAVADRLQRDMSDLSDNTSLPPEHGPLTWEDTAAAALLGLSNGAQALQDATPTSDGSSRECTGGDPPDMPEQGSLGAGNNNLKDGPSEWEAGPVSAGKST
ncbi:polyprotein [Scallop picorna-like virus 2]|nr:polyprotein [Scallop picorna-like virus 2]